MGKGACPVCYVIEKSLLGGREKFQVSDSSEVCHDVRIGDSGTEAKS